MDDQMQNGYQQQTYSAPGSYQPPANNAGNGYQQQTYSAPGSSYQPPSYDAGNSYQQQNYSAPGSYQPPAYDAGNGYQPPAYPYGASNGYQQTSPYGDTSGMKMPNPSGYLVMVIIGFLCGVIWGILGASYYSKMKTAIAMNNPVEANACAKKILTFFLIGIGVNVVFTIFYIIVFGSMA